MLGDWDNKHESEEMDSEKPYSFLQETRKDEQIKPKKIIGNILRVAGKGLVFGVGACLAFCALRPWVETRFARENDVVTIPEDEEALPEEQVGQEQIEEDFSIDNYREMSKVLKGIADEVSKCVVTVEAVLVKDHIEDAETEPTSVSGVVVWKNLGEILIAAPSRVLEDSGEVQVTFGDGRTYSTSLKKQDKNTQIAVFSVSMNSLKETTKNYVQSAVLGNSRLMSKGMGVIALGNPFGYAGGAGYGIISSTENKIVVADGQYEVLTTDITAAENGSSILFNIDGEMIGIADQRTTGRGSNNLVSGYAISGIKNVIELLSNGEGVPYIGIRGIEVTEDISGAQGIPQGIYVKETEADSPAMQAGIQSGDVLVEMDGKPIKTLSNCGKQLSNFQVGQSIKVVVQREGTEGYEEVPFEMIIGSKE